MRRIVLVLVIGIGLVFFISWLLIFQTFQRTTVLDRVPIESTIKSPSTNQHFLNKKFIFAKDGMVYSAKLDGQDVQKISFTNGETIAYHPSEQTQLGQSSDGRFITFVDLKERILTVVDLKLEKSVRISSLSTPSYLSSPIRSEVYYKKADRLYAYDMVSDKEFTIVPIGNVELINISKYGDKIVLGTIGENGSTFSFVELAKNNLIPFDTKRFSNSLPPFFAKDAEHFIFIKNDRIVLYPLSKAEGEELFFSKDKRIVSAALSPIAEEIYILGTTDGNSLELIKIDLLTSKMETIDTLSMSPVSKGMQRGVFFFNFIHPQILTIHTVQSPEQNFPKDPEAGWLMTLQTMRALQQPYEIWRYNLVNKQLVKIQ